MSRSFFFLIAGLCCWSAAANCFAQAPAKTSSSPTAAPEPSATPTTRALIDSMDSADLKEAIQLLKNNYIKPDALNETELSRAAFEGILTRLGRGVILLPKTNTDSAGAAEAAAGVSHIYDKAVVIGQQSAGRAVEYSDLKLPSGKVLRVAVGEAILPEGHPLFPGGLKPDVPVEMPAADKREVFQASREKGMTPFVAENSRPHLNEAA